MWGPLPPVAKREHNPREESTPLLLPLHSLVALLSSRTAPASSSFIAGAPPALLHWVLQYRVRRDLVDHVVPVVHHRERKVGAVEPVQDAGYVLPLSHHMINLHIYMRSSVFLFP